MALDPSDPWTYEGLSQALIFNGRPKEGRAYLDAAMRVDPGWTDWRHYQAGLAAFGEGRFEEAAASLEKIDLRSPEPWPKFYGLQVLVSAYGHLGRSDEIATAMEKLKAVLQGERRRRTNRLLTQSYFVFKNEADIERLLDGLRKAGVPELPADVDLNPKDRLTGPEIKSLIFGHELRGRRIAPSVREYKLTSSADGSTNTTIGSWSNKGLSWVQGNFLCDAYPKSLSSCSVIFRNPSGTLEQLNEYQMIGRFNRFEFSVVK